MFFANQFVLLLLAENDLNVFKFCTETWVFSIAGKIIVGSSNATRSCLLELLLGVASLSCSFEVFLGCAFGGAPPTCPSTLFRFADLRRQAHWHEINGGAPLLRHLLTFCELLGVL